MDFLAIKATEIGLPLVRPLPTICAYAGGVQTRPLVPAVLEEEFYAHVDCLIDLVETACLRAGVPSSVCEEVTQKAVNLTRSKKNDLVAGVNELLFNLSRMSGIHKSALKHELSAQPQIYRDIYWGRVYTKKITLIHQGDGVESAEKAAKSLREGCYYDVTVMPETHIALKPMSSDFVVFLPTDGPIRPATLATASTLGLPILMLIDLGRKVETADPVMVRTAHQYTQTGLKVLYRPFTSLRLFTSVDTRYVDHLFQNPAFAGARAKGEVA